MDFHLIIEHQIFTSGYEAFSRLITTEAQRDIHSPVFRWYFCTVAERPEYFSLLALSLTFMITTKKPYSTLVIPPLETSAAAAVEAVGTIPAGTPGLERWTSLHLTKSTIRCSFIIQTEILIKPRHQNPANS